MTIAEERRRALTHFNDDFIHDMEKARHISNCFYRLCGMDERLLYLTNDESTCDLRSTVLLEEKAERARKRLEEELKPYNLKLDYFGYMPTITTPNTNTALERYFYQ